MRYRTVLLLLLLLVCVAPGSAQNPPKEQLPGKSDDVVIVTTNLVQVDAIVTDKGGRQVTDLRAEDFELLENGHERQIAAFSYIPLASQKPLTNAPAKTDAGNSSPPLTLHAVRPEQVRRVVAILVDDFGLSFESIARLRSALEKFILEQTSPTDLIGVIRTSGGPGAMQQFTSNRSQLLATIRRIRWYPTGRGGMSAVDSFSPINNNEDGVELKGYSSSRLPNLSSKEYFPGTLASLGFVIEGLARFPGRKSIVLVSDNLPATSKDAQIGGVTRVLDRLIERANQYLIVISTMDARGLPKAGLTADDSQHNLAANQINTRSRERRMKFNVEQDALSYLAQQTGGIFVHDNNDLNHGLRRIVDSEQGYYLLAYRPDDLATKAHTSPERTYKISLRLKRPDLQVRTRSGFHRVARTKEAEGTLKGKDEFLREALSSPFVREDVRLKMTALFTGGSQIKILLHVDPRDIALAKSEEDIYQGSFDVVALAFDDNGKVASEVRRTPTLRVPSDSYERLQRDGLVYAITMPMKNPGAYQVRLALRDGGSGRLGSDSQFVEVPDAGKTRLTVSGFIVQGVTAAGDHQSETPGNPEANKVVDGSRHEAGGGGAAVRRFGIGDLLVYSYLVYGVRRHHVTDSNLLSQIRVFRGNKEVFTGRVQPLVIADESNHEGIVAGGTFRLGRELPPGEYFLQVIVTDKLAPREKLSSEQWIDFEIVESGRAH